MTKRCGCSTDRLVQPYLDNDIIVGMTIGVLRDGKQEVFGYGRMSRDDRRVPDGDTIYELGSATKVLTGILLADAVVRGQVKLDQPAGELLPAGVKMPANGDRAITLQDLSTHVSGLPTIPDNMKFGDPNNPYADYREEDLYAFLNKHKLARAPGTKYEYSNLGQGLLGHLLSLRAKSTYEDLVRNRIAVPLKMSSTRITIDKESQSRFAPGHMADGQPAANWDLSVLAGAGGVRTTVNDMLLFAAANLAPPKGKLGEAIEMAWTIHQKPIKQGERVARAWLASDARWNSLAQRRDGRLSLDDSHQPQIQIERDLDDQYRHARGRSTGNRHLEDDFRCEGRPTEIREGRSMCRPKRYRNSSAVTNWPRVSCSPSRPWTAS